MFRLQRKGAKDAKGRKWTNCVGVPVSLGLTTDPISHGVPQAPTNTLRTFASFPPLR